MCVPYSAAIAVALMVASARPVSAAETEAGVDPLFRTLDLDVGETARVQVPGLAAPVSVKLLDLAEERCELRGAVREAVASVEVDGEAVRLVSALYNLPRAVGRVQVDCPVTRGYTERSSKDNVWALEKAARLRVWSAGSPWIRTGSFAWPVGQRWFASDTQMGNDPCYVNACDVPGEKDVYYHYGLDFGGAEGLVKVSAATDGIVASKAGELIPGDHPRQVQPRGDVVYLRDDRGWYWRYSHLKAIDPTVRLGDRVRIGDAIGILGKEGGSGGWSHLHLDLCMPQPSGRWGIADAYPFAFQAWRERANPRLIAVARPHRVAWAGDTVALDAGRSWHAEGPGRIRPFEWRLTDGRVLSGPRIEVRYDRPGHWSEVLKVTDDAGEVSYDIAVVQTFDRKSPLPVPPALHVASWPTDGIRVGDDVTFKARTFGVRPDEGEETWDFGDGSAPATTRSDGNADQHAPEGYAVTSHRFERAGDWIVSARRTNDRGETATGRVWIRVAPR